MKWKPSFRFYKAAYCITRVLIGFIYGFEVKGRENIPDGAAMVCSNHSSMKDPLFIAYAFGIRCYLHFIAKIELFRIPVVSLIVAKLGAISVDRNMTDIATIKKTLAYFKNNEKVAIFPEGTRASEAEYIAAKSGAVKLAERAGVPLVPVYVPRKKKLFRKVKVIIGDPYYIEKQSEKRSSDEYTLLVEQLMRKIEALKPSTRSGEM